MTSEESMVTPWCANQSSRPEKAGVAVSDCVITVRNAAAAITTVPPRIRY